MPLYEYECSQCHRRTEKIQKFSDAEITVCPHCGGALERTVTAPNVQFKGGGWYKDLYSSAKPPAANAGSSGESGTAASGSESGPASSPTSGESSGSSAPAPATSGSTPASSTAASPAPAAAASSKS